MTNWPKKIANRFVVERTSLAVIWGLGRVKLFRFYRELYPRSVTRYSGPHRPRWGGVEFEFTASYGRWLFAITPGLAYVQAATGHWYTGENQPAQGPLGSRTRSRWSLDPTLAAKTRVGQFPADSRNRSHQTLHRFHPAGRFRRLNRGAWRPVDTSLKPTV